MSWKRSNRLGVVFASTTVCKSSVTAAGSAAPYTIGYVRLEEEFLMLATLERKVTTGTHVRVDFIETDGRFVPICRPATSAAPSAENV